MKAKIAAILIASVVAAPSLADKPEMTARAFVESGVAAYKQADATAAIKAWIKGSALEGNPQALTQANALRQVEDFYGKPIGMDVVKDYEIGPRIHLLYVTLDYEKGAAFARFQLYRTDSGEWVTMQFLFNADATQIFPACLYEC